ncbi:DEAD/DEAH box helicase, partial [Actinomyces sp. oral taxon 171]
EQLAARAAAVPAIVYPEELPVSARREEIAAAISEHQVVIVAGETGSGKTTQLPKICLELGRGITGMIGHTQPRRIAARSVAERIASELGTPIGPGGVVGYQVRFTEEVGDNTLVKLMTDGILLAEIQSDPQLRRYDTIIVDEAHERSLNIDFILGYLARLLPQRPDLKVIITSATIDSERFAEHFGREQIGDRGRPLGETATVPAPVIEVSGRTYPVEVRYRPLAPDDAPPASDDAGSEPADSTSASRPGPAGPGELSEAELEALT